MSDSITFEISIPSDNEGYILLQCGHCGMFFKVQPSDIEDDQLLDLYCPSCGLISENYLTEDVIDLAETIARNYAINAINDAFKGFESKGKNNLLQIKISSKQRPEYESPIRTGIEAMEITHFECCHRDAKIKPLLKLTGCYCPFCGVKEYEAE